MAHKEIRKQVILEYAKEDKNFNLKNCLFEAVNIHNHNIHTTTKYRPIEIINNSDENIMKIVIENIKNRLKIDSKKYDDIKEGSHILIIPQVHRSGKRIVKKKFKIKSRINQILATVKYTYGNGLLVVNIDIGDYEFEKDEVLLVDYNLCSLISEEQWEKKSISKNKKKKLKNIEKQKLNLNL